MEKPYRKEVPEKYVPSTILLRQTTDHSRSIEKPYAEGVYLLQRSALCDTFTLTTGKKIFSSKRLPQGPR